MAVDLGTAFGRIVVDARGASTGAATASRAFASIGKGAAIGLLGVSAAFSAAVGISVKVAASFEEALSGVAAVSGATAAQMAELRDQALEVGAATRFSAREAAAGQTELAKAGVELSDILGGALPGALALAAAGDVEVAEAASYAANAMNLFGLAGSEVTKIADAFASAANTTTADVGDFGLALTQGGSAAKLAGLDFLQTITFLEAMAKAGVKGSDAGTSLKAALIQLLNPTAKQAALAKDLGVNFIDANGRMKDAATISGELRKATAGYTDAERAKTFAVLAGTDGLRVLSSLYAAGPKLLQGYERQLGTAGTAAETAAKRQDNLAGALEELGGSVETLQIKLGSAAIPILRDLAAAAVEGINALTGSRDLEAGLDRFSSGFDGLVDSAQSAGSALLPVLSQLAGIAGSAFDAIGAGASGAIPVIGTLGTVTLTLASAVLSVVGPMASFTATIVALPGVAQGATSALVGLGAAFLVLRVAGTVAAITGAVSSFLALAGSVRSASQAAALAGAAFPRMAIALSALGGPAGLAAAAIGLTVAGVVALSSGMFRGQSTSQILAAALEHVARASKDAAGAVRDLDSATTKLGDANLRAKDAALRVAEASAELARIRRDPSSSPLQVQRAELNLTQARRDAAKATRDQALAEKGAASQASAGVVALASLATEQGRATDKTRAAYNTARALSDALGENSDIAGDLAGDLGRLTIGSASTAQRMAALQTAARRAAAGITGTSAPARKAKTELEAIANASPGQLRQFAEDINAGVKRGQSRASAGAAAINKLLASVGDGVTVDLSSLAASITSSGESVVAAAARVAARTRAELAKANADTRSSPSANDRLKTSLDRMASIGAAGHRKVAAEVRTGVDAIVAEEQALGTRIEGLEARFAREDTARERRRLVRQREAAARRLAQAKQEEREAAREALAQSRREVAAFDQEQARNRRRDAARRPLEARRDAITTASAALSGVESSLSDVSSRVASAIDRGLAASLDNIGARLSAALSAIDTSPEAARVGAITGEVDALRLSRQNRDAARQQAELGRELADAQAVTERRRQGLARARTASERQAAQELLRQAVEAERVAAEAVADAQEDARVLELERERDHLTGLLESRREAANATAEVERAAAQAAADAQRAGLERQLGDLQENLRRRAITYGQFVEGVRAITGDPALRADLERSGRELGLSFTEGLERSITGAEGAARSMAKAIARYLRLRSPAEAGPLAHDFRSSGQVIGRDLAQGMASSVAVVGAQARALASAAALAGAGRGADRGAGPASWAGADGPAPINITTTYPVESPREMAARLDFERRYRPRGR